VAAVFPRELEGALRLIAVVGIEMGLPVDSGLAPFLPLWGLSSWWRWRGVRPRRGDPHPPRTGLDGRAARDLRRLVVGPGAGDPAHGPPEILSTGKVHPFAAIKYEHLYREEIASGQALVEEADAFRALVSAFDRIVEVSRIGIERGSRKSRGRRPS
jgi:hypothetical protein